MKRLRFTPPVCSNFKVKADDHNKQGVAPSSQPETDLHPHRLVGAETLLEELFPDERDRPCLRWLRKMQAQRVIPYVKIGRLVRFDVGQVRAAIDRSFTVRDK